MENEGVNSTTPVNHKTITAEVHQYGNKEVRAKPEGKPLLNLQTKVYIEKLVMDTSEK